MHNWLKRTWWLLVLGLVGCATLVAPNAAPTPQTSPLTSPLTSPVTASDVLIRYHRSGGIVGTDETWVIYANGQVDHSGRGTGASKQLTPDQIAALSGLLRSADVLALRESYVPQNTCCDRFMYEFTILIDGRSQTVTTLDAAPDEPPALSKLRDLLNSLLK